MIYNVPPLPPAYLDVVEEVNYLRRQLRYSTQTNPRRWTGLIRQSAFARAIQSSNSIEGYNVTYEDAVAAVEGEEPLDGKTEAWAAVSGYRAAMTYILQLADDPYYVHNEGTLRSLHYIMVGFDLNKHPGRWRPGGIYVRREPSGETVYEGPDHELVPPLMREFIESLNSEDDLPPLIKAAMAHLNLVMIHPFSDGNGRMGRAVQTMMLAREGIVDPLFSSIEEYLGHNTQDYYRVLAEVGQGKWNPHHDPLPWIRFCLTAHYRQAETLLRRIKEVEKLWGMLEGELAYLKLNERMLLALVDAALGVRLRNATYRKTADVSDEVAGKDLRTLVGHQLIQPHGEKRGRYYSAAPALLALRVRAREPKVVTDPFTNTTEPGREDQLSLFEGGK